jgi:hypothetical protein
MFLSNPFFEPANDWVIVWLGDLNMDELDEYLDEPGSVGHDDPISAFCRDLGRWYDHDFVWSEGVDEATSVLRLCEMNRVEPVEFMQAIVERSGDGDAMCLLVLWNARKIDNAERSFAAGRIRCIGCWEQEAPLTDPE